MTLLDAKKQLYLELLKKLPEDVTDNEAQMGYLLSQDLEIQAILREALSKDYKCSYCGNTKKETCNKCSAYEACTVAPSGLFDCPPCPVCGRNNKS